MLERDQPPLPSAARFTAYLVSGLAVALALAGPAQAAKQFAPAVESVVEEAVSQTNGDHALAVAGNGEAVAFWGTGGPDFLMSASLRGATGPFGETFAVGAGAGTGLPKLATNAAGHTVAVWRHSTGGNPEQVWAAVRPAGASAFGPAFQVSTNLIPTPATSPRVAVDGSGRALVVWVMRTVADTPSSTRVMQRFVSPAGVPLDTPYFLSAPDNGFPEVVMNAAGESVTSYRSAFDAGPGTPVSVYLNAAGDSFDYESFPDGSGFAASAALDPAGNTVVVYQAGGELHARYRPAGGTTNFTDEETVDGAGSPSMPALGIDGAGNATVAYEAVSGQRSIQAARRPAGGATEFGAPFDIDTPSVDDRANLSLAVGLDGTALAGWTATGNGPAFAAVWPAGAARFDAPTGPVALSGTVVRTTRAGVANDGDGIVTFASRAGDGFDFGIDALVYSGDPPVTAFDAAPKLTKVSLLRKRFRVGAKATAKTAAKRKRAKGGTAFRFTLSEQATVRIAIERRTTGRKRRGRCVKPSRAPRGAKRCTRFVKAGTLTRRKLAAGKRSVKFSGRIGRKALKPGRYRATLTATDDGGKRGKPVKLAFRVVR